MPINLDNIKPSCDVQVDLDMFVGVINIKFFRIPDITTLNDLKEFNNLPGFLHIDLNETWHTISLSHPGDDVQAQVAQAIVDCLEKEHKLRVKKAVDIYHNNRFIRKDEVKSFI